MSRLTLLVVESISSASTSLSTMTCLKMLIHIFIVYVSFGCVFWVAIVGVIQDTDLCLCVCRSDARGDLAQRALPSHLWVLQRIQKSSTRLVPCTFFCWELVARNVPHEFMVLQVQERFEVDIKALPEQIDTSTYSKLCYLGVYCVLTLSAHHDWLFCAVPS